MYLIQIDHVVYTLREGKTRPAWADEEGRFTLAGALREVYGCANAYILREAPGGKLVVVAKHAGRAYSDLTHEPSGQVLPRGRRARTPGLTWRSPGYWQVVLARLVAAPVA